MKTIPIPLYRVTVRTVSLSGVVREQSDTSTLLAANKRLRRAIAAVQYPDGHETFRPVDALPSAALYRSGSWLFRAVSGAIRVVSIHPSPEAEHSPTH